MKSKVLSNYDAFYNMVLLTTILSNVADSSFDEDASKIIRFIGNAYELNEDVIDMCIKTITEDLVSISVIGDVNAYVTSQNYDTVNNELNSLYSIKCDVVSVINNIKAPSLPDFNPSWFDYAYYKPYCPEIRFSQLERTATSGDVIVNKAVAIMLALGIGTKKDINSAVLRLKQCALWCDMFSINILKYLLKNENNPKAKTYEELSRLEKYFNEGRTLLPKEEEKNYSLEARQLFACISSIKQDIILLENIRNIDYSFVEVILLDSVDYYKKLYYINNYKSQQWKEVTNSSVNPSSKIGFKVGRND